MKKFPLKLKIIFIGSIFLFMFIYMFVFGKNNAAIGLTMAMAAFMNLGNDLSFKPKTSFIRLSILFLILGFGAYLNNPISIFACILTFFIVFATTFTSYHLFGSDVYLPFLMAYFMMIAYPVSFEELPLRGISLIFGAAFILALNLLVNKNKDYKLSKETMDKLISEINRAIDLKLDGKEVSRESFKIANNFYSSLFNKFEYKYFPSSKQESALNIVKSFQYIGFILSDYDLSGDELTYIKRVLTKIDDISPDEIFKSVKVESDGMYLVLLNLEIIANEIKNKDLTKETADIKSLKSSFKPLVKYCFSFRSAKFTFAFKMAIVLTLLEVLTLMFNLPYTKWLYLAAIPLMQPYIDDAKFTSKSRLLGTLIGAFIFTILIIICPYLPLSPNEFMIIVMMICVVGMIYEFEKKAVFNAFTTLMSITASLMYIAPDMAIELKILWVAACVILVNIINFGFLPYSVEKETKKNLAISYNLNKKSLDLIKKRCHGDKSGNKNTLLVVSNIVRQNIEITEDNLELYGLQCRITDISNFILSYLDVYYFSDDFKFKLIKIIDNDEDVADSNEIKDTVIIRSLKHVKKLYNCQNQLII